jgi:hypothetical protein
MQGEGKGGDAMMMVVGVENSVVCRLVTSLNMRIDQPEYISTGRSKEWT